MNRLNRTLLIPALGMMLVSVAQADSWSCRHGDDVREVFVERIADGPVPCNVVYSKLTEGVENQVLWNAQVDPDYCANRATAFVAKLESWGWICVETIRDNQN